jgi:hypothetical protein
MTPAKDAIRTVGAALLAWGAVSGLCNAQTLTTSISRDAANAQVAGASRQPSASADGRFVAFSSTATTLVVGDTNASADVFVKDRQTGAVTRVSITTNGTEAAGDSVSPDISSDGRYVTFVSTAPLTAGDTNTGACAGAGVPGPTCPDVFVHDRTTGSTTRVSVATGGTQSNAASGEARISGDGRFVAFVSTASNLVAGDTNELTDVFVHDRLTATTSRVSVATGGAQSDRAATAPTITDDGGRITFISDATTLDPTADPLPCAPSLLVCTRAYLRTVASSTTSRVPLGDATTGRGGPPLKRGYRVSGAAIAADGGSVAAALDGITPDGDFAGIIHQLATYSFATGTTRNLSAVSYPASAAPVVQRFSSLAITRSGRAVAACFRGYAGDTFVIPVADTVTGLSYVGAVGPPLVLGGPETGQPDCDGVALTDDGLTTFFASSGAAIVAGDTNAAFDVFAIDRDTDDDGLPSDWESAFGLNGADPADGSLDSDTDGSTNLLEFGAGTHPRGVFKYYLAEAAENSFFSTEIAVFNPNPLPAGTFATVVAEFRGAHGTQSVSPLRRLYDRTSGLGSTNFSAASDPGLFPDQAFSTIVESDRPLAVERTLTWGGGVGEGYGSHAETAVTGSGTTWHFAEGATHGRFDLFYLLQNPGSAAATATITYLRPAPLAPIVRAYPLLPNSRRTIWVDQEPGLEATDVSARIDADQPIFAERAMYLSRPGQPFAGGTASAGVSTPATEWFIAEGATGSFFDLYILIGNPLPGAAEVTVTYLLPDGTSIAKMHQVAGHSRRTIAVAGEDARLVATSVAAAITATNGAPIVVERAMWWPSPDWYEGSVTAATSTAGPRWAFTGAYLDPRPDTETYLLVANLGAAAAQVTITATIGTCQVTVPVPARGRYTTGLKSLCPAAVSFTRPFRVSGTVESDGPPIVVERATYWSAAGQFWAAGASNLLTRLP